jgi:hypothetical protein
MGYGFMVWAVDIDKLKQVTGSKDDKLRRMLGGRFKRDIARLDEMFDAPNTYEALRQIIDGTIPEGAQGAVYSYAFKLIVQHFGAFLDNGALYPWGHDAEEPVDRALAAMGVPLTIRKLQYSGLPVKLPYPDDFPSTGWIDAPAVQEIAAAFAKAPAVDMDAGTREIVACLRKMSREAADKGRGLVSYYH